MKEFKSQAQKLKRYLKAHKSLDRGDTIVEVMVSMTVLAIVIIISYTLSSRAFQSGLNSQYRDQAVSYSQQQLELIKEADLNNPSTISTYTTTPNTPFCIDPKTKDKISADKCVFGNGYIVTYKYINNDPIIDPSLPKVSQTFLITANWDSPGGTKQQSVIYYKPSNSFNGSVSACVDVADPLCAKVK